MNEPKWTTHHVTMPEDKALEYLEDLMKVVNKGYTDPGYVIALSMAIDKMRTPSPDNKPLTLTELKQMDGEPVWVVSKFSTIPTGWFLPHKNFYGKTVDLYGPTCVVREDELRRCGTPLLFYRRPPEKGD